MRGRPKSATILILLLSLVILSCGRRPPEYEVIDATGEFLELELSTDASPPVRFYTYRADGKNVNFFVRKDRDGTVRTHFDACFSCFKYRLGYVLENERVVCRACRIGYDLKEPVWDFVGPCAPITLSSKVSGGKIRIKRGDLDKGARFF